MKNIYSKSETFRRLGLCPNNAPLDSAMLLGRSNYCVALGHILIFTIKVFRKKLYSTDEDREKVSYREILFCFFLFNVLVYALFPGSVWAQFDSTKSFCISLEYRPRMEYRNGYRKLPNDTTHAAIFGTQRSRLNFAFTQPKFKFHTSIQDLRVWGQYGQTSTNGSLNVFEAFVETYYNEHVFLRMGRQKVELENGRLFSAANWNQAGRSHDGINFIFKNKRLTSELMLFFNQTSEQIFGTDFRPVGFSNYKLLNVHFLSWKFAENFNLITINSLDGYQGKTNINTLYMRATSGGRLEFESEYFYATISGYYQYGQLSNAAHISAYYFQPEISYRYKKFYTRLGMEYLSGDDGKTASVISKSFVPLYGVAWKFMGNMDYFTYFPDDVKKGGLVNPYLFLYLEVNKRITVRADFHVFYLQNNVIDSKNSAIDKYLGAESDLSFKYLVNNFTTIDYGFSFMKAEQSMEFLKGGNSNRIPVWSYLMITFKPEIFKHSQIIRS